MEFEGGMVEKMDSDKQYEQLNLRTRWYTAQIWYVPFAFMGILALGVDKLNNLTGFFKSFIYFLLSFFSFAIFVHLSSLKFYERKNVLKMQQMENPVISGGGTEWYLSFTSYMKTILVFCSVSFLWIGIENVCWVWIWRGILLLLYILAFLFILIQDRKRNKPYLNQIRENFNKFNKENE
jgi:hypothetical protein